MEPEESQRLKQSISSGLSVPNGSVESLNFQLPSEIEYCITLAEKRFSSASSQQRFTLSGQLLDWCIQLILRASHLLRKCQQQDSSSWTPLEWGSACVVTSARVWSFIDKFLEATQHRALKASLSPAWSALFNCWYLSEKIDEAALVARKVYCDLENRALLGQVTLELIQTWCQSISRVNSRSSVIDHWLVALLEQANNMVTVQSNAKKTFTTCAQQNWLSLFFSIYSRENSQCQEAVKDLMTSGLLKAEYLDDFIQLFKSSLPYKEALNRNSSTLLDNQSAVGYRGVLFQQVRVLFESNPQHAPWKELCLILTLFHQSMNHISLQASHRQLIFFVYQELYILAWKNYLRGNLNALIGANQLLECLVQCSHYRLTNDIVGRQQYNSMLQMTLDLLSMCEKDSASIEELNILLDMLAHVVELDVMFIADLLPRLWDLLLRLTAVKTVLPLKLMEAFALHSRLDTWLSTLLTALLQSPNLALENNLATTSYVLDSFKIKCQNLVPLTATHMFMNAVNLISNVIFDDTNQAKRQKREPFPNRVIAFTISCIIVLIESGKIEISSQLLQGMEPLWTWIVSSLSSRTCISTVAPLIVALSNVLPMSIVSIHLPTLLLIESAESTQFLPVLRQRAHQLIAHQDEHFDRLIKSLFLLIENDPSQNESLCDNLELFQFATKENISAFVHWLFDGKSTKGNALLSSAMLFECSVLQNCLIESWLLKMKMLLPVSFHPFLDSTNATYNRNIFLIDRNVNANELSKWISLLTWWPLDFIGAEWRPRVWMALLCSDICLAGIECDPACMFIVRQSVTKFSHSAHCADIGNENEFLAWLMNPGLKETSFQRWICESSVQLFSHFIKSLSLERNAVLLDALLANLSSETLNYGCSILRLYSEHHFVPILQKYWNVLLQNVSLSREFLFLSLPFIAGTDTTEKLSFALISSFHENNENSLSLFQLLLHCSAKSQSFSIIQSEKQLNAFLSFLKSSFSLNVTIATDCFIQLNQLLPYELNRLLWKFVLDDFNSHWAFDVLLSAIRARIQLPSGSLLVSRVCTVSCRNETIMLKQLHVLEQLVASKRWRIESWEVTQILTLCIQFTLKPYDAMHWNENVFTQVCSITMHLVTKHSDAVSHCSVLLIRLFQRLLLTERNSLLCLNSMLSMQQYCRLVEDAVPILKHQSYLLIATFVQRLLLDGRTVNQSDALLRREMNRYFTKTALVKLFDSLAEMEREHLLVSLDGAYRPLLKELYTSYNKDYKFTGKA